MNSYTNNLLSELRSLVADLGKDGGLISPSVYDTAQVLRFFPPNEDVEPALTWLLSKQHTDGGWGSPETPYARAVPTLAAVLALRMYPQYSQTHEAARAGFVFFQQQTDQWSEMPLDALPIATEMILPYLIEEANLAGLRINCQPYETIYQLQHQKLQKIAKMPLRPGTPPTYSWEALGKDVDSILPDHSGGIGHSPAATAAWLQKASHRPDLAKSVASAQQYLAQAAKATGLHIPGVAPSVWPIIGNELAYVPYALLATGLLQHPLLQDVINPIMEELWIVMQRGHGVSFGEYFTPDVDDTGLALAALHATSLPVDPAVILQFKNGDHFCTFHHELNPSVFANAHALYGLAYLGERYPAAERFLLERQCADGRWLADKLHSSWLYTTLEVVLVLNRLGYRAELQQAAHALVQHQKPDGGWGGGEHSTRVETSYALITLSTLHQAGLLNTEMISTLQRGHQFLSNGYRPGILVDDMLWLGKELYVPYRVDRAYELSALLSVEVERVSV